MEREDEFEEEKKWQIVFCFEIVLNLIKVIYTAT